MSATAQVEREEHLLTRFSGAHPSVPVVRVPAIAGDAASRRPTCALAVRMTLVDVRTAAP